MRGQFHEKSYIETPPPLRHWRGLGSWNLYFLAKFALLWSGSLDFHPLANLTFAAALLVPLPPVWLHRLRHIIAIPVGVALFYYDTWLPPASRLITGAEEISKFSTDYLLELAQRFIDLPMIGTALVLLVAYLFLSQWLRATVFTVAALLYIALPNLPKPIATQTMAHATINTTAPTTTQLAATPPASDKTANTAPLPPTNANLEAHLQAFYKYEKTRKTAFPPITGHASPFDLLILNICSLSWADLEDVNLSNHPLFGKMDIIFDNFNSATSYSAPAGIRLLRASCGQEPHSDLYKPPPPGCFLFDNLRELGFTTSLALNHNGKYGGYLDSLRAQGQLPAPTVKTAQLPRALNAFDGSPVWRDLDVLNAWWQQRQQTSTQRAALFYNTITLHDGNRFITPNGGSKRADYQPRLQALLDDLDTFLAELERSGRPVVVLIVPEHGAALRGDRLQIAGLREIPSPNITHVPVLIKLVGVKTPHQGGPIHISAQSSFLALSEIVSRLRDGKAFSAPDFDWQALVKDLPKTERVSETDSSVVMFYQNSPYIRLGDSGWQEYPH